MNSRELRGQDLAAQDIIRQKGHLWLVPSQSGKGKYTVDLTGTVPVCTCPDYELRNVKCKHIYAVEITIRRTTSITEQTDGAITTVTETTTQTTTKRITYRQNWPAYNAAQTQGKALFQSLLHDLCQGIPDLPHTPGPGRHHLPMCDLVFAAVFKVYSAVSCRRFMSDLTDAQAKGHLSHIPHFNVILRHLALPEMTAILKSLIERSSLPLKAIESTFAVDSSGFSTCQYVRWYDAKYGREVDMRDWVKVHLMCGVTTNIVTSVEITERYCPDTVQFASLVDATARNFAIRDVTADKAYLSRRHLEYVASLGATAYIPFKSNTTGYAGGSAEWERLWHLFSLNRQTFLDHYHQRSNVESTFAMLKSKFGAAIRSKGDIAQINELLAKVLCHNICCVIQSMFELGIEAKFVS